MHNLRWLSGFGRRKFSSQFTERFAAWTLGAAAVLYVADNCRELYQERNLVHKVDYPKLLLLKLVPLKLASRLWGYVNSFQLPIWTRNFVIGRYGAFFEANLEEAEKPLVQYRNLADFFSRRLKPSARPIAFGDLVSPCDGQVLSIGRLDTDGFIEQIKGVKYKASHLVGIEEQRILGDAMPKTPTHQADSKSETKSSWGSLVKSSFSFLLSPFYRPRSSSLYQIVIYLRPGDYHRFHSPCIYKIDEARHFEGELLSVAPFMVRWLPGLFSLNERVALLGRWKHGFMSMVAVGATNVGSIEFNFQPYEVRTNSQISITPNHFSSYSVQQLARKGEELGVFKFGSTVVLYFEAPSSWRWDVSLGDRVKMGQRLGTA